MLYQKTYYFKTLLLVLILFFSFIIAYFILFPHEAFAMDPYTSDEDMISDEDVRSRLDIARKENYMSYNGIYTENTRLDLFRSLYPHGYPVDYSIINDPYDNEKYFDLPLTMIYGEPKNIKLSSGIYSGCIASNIDGLLIWPEYHPFYTEFVKDYTQVLAKDSNITSVSLGTRTDGHHSVFVYLKCHDIYGYKYHWTIWEKTHIAKIWSYKAFKNRWDNEANIWLNIDEKIRNDIIIEVKDLLGIKRVDNNIRKSVRTEIEKFLRKSIRTGVEKLIRETRPINE